MASRSLDDLHVAARSKVRALVTAAKVDGLEILIYCTLRPLAEQAELYAQGRTKPGPIVTWARPGQSAHNYGLAADGVVLVGGKPLWKPKTVADFALWERYGALAEKCGLEWAGRWPKAKREFPHVQVPNWRDYIA